MSRETCITGLLVRVDGLNPHGEGMHNNPVRSSADNFTTNIAESTTVNPVVDAARQRDRKIPNDLCYDTFLIELTCTSFKEAAKPVQKDDTWGDSPVHRNELRASQGLLFLQAAGRLDSDICLAKPAQNGEALAVKNLWWLCSHLGEQSPA